MTTAALIYPHQLFADHPALANVGTAVLVDDDAMKERLFSPMARAWFPGGPGDPDLALVRVSMLAVEYWIVRENTLVQMLKMARAAVTGTPPVIGEHGTLPA